MATFLVFVLSHFFPADNQARELNHPVGSALVLCAKLGIPPEQIHELFGPPDCSWTGRIDWGTNPDRYLLLGYTRYGVWVEWEAGPLPRTGKGPIFRVLHGGLE